MSFPLASVKCPDATAYAYQICQKNGSQTTEVAIIICSHSFLFNIGKLASTTTPQKYKTPYLKTNYVLYISSLYNTSK
jgi:hypothetical protein